MDLSQIDSDGFAAPRVPRAFPPLAPLGPIELPPRDSFGLTRPVAPVGRNYASDGGIPRPVERKTATVVPPLLLTSACIERIGEMVWACVGERNVLIIRARLSYFVKLLSLYFTARRAVFVPRFQAVGDEFSNINILADTPVCVSTANSNGKPKKGGNLPPLIFF